MPRPTIRPHPLTLLAIAGTMFSLSLAPALAQEGVPTPQVPSKAEAAASRKATRPNDENPGPTITVEFPGGNAKAFVEAVRNAASNGGGPSVNVIMPKEAENEPIPAISLRQVSALTALKTLEYSSPPNGMFTFSVGPVGSPADPSQTFAIKYSQRAFNPNGPQFGAPTPAPRQETQVFSIRELIEAPPGLESNPDAATTTETVINAVRSASELDTSTISPPPELMLHKDSMLLLVRATSDQQRTIAAVLQQLRNTVETKRSRATDIVNRKRAADLEQAEFRAQMDMNASQLTECKRRMEMANEKLDRLRDLQAKGQSSQTDISNAEAEMVAARGSIERLQISRQMLEERRALTEARIKAGGDPGDTGETPLAVVYNFKDLEPFANDILALFKAVSPARGGGGGANSTYVGNCAVSVRATPAQHKVIVIALNAMRRAKANEPNLPGQDVEDLIRKSSDKTQP